MSFELSGKTAEFIALQYLRLKGYVLVARNYVTGRGTGAGEVDLIIKNQTDIVFVEVKKRKNLERRPMQFFPASRNEFVALPRSFWRIIGNMPLLMFVLMFFYYKRRSNLNISKTLFKFWRFLPVFFI